MHTKHQLSTDSVDNPQDKTSSNFHLYGVEPNA
jgi:hypothetical protein